MSTIPIHIKRVYEKPEASDGKRILVDRLWPRGLTKEQAAVDEWMKEIAPSHELRKWYAHRLEHYEKFKELYLQELLQDKPSQLLRQIREMAEDCTVTLLYAAKDTTMNQAVVLKEIIETS